MDELTQIVQRALAFKTGPASKDFENTLWDITVIAAAPHVEIVVPGDEFIAYLCESIPDVMTEAWSAPTPSSVFASLQLPDLFLACACSQGNAKAIEVFFAMCNPTIGAAFAKLNVKPADKNDMLQQLSEKLFVGDNQKIRSYSGKGELRKWAASVATRLYLNRVRKYKRESQLSEEKAFTLRSEGDLADLRYLKEQVQEDFTAAFQEALQELPPDKLLLLRYYHVDGMTIDNIAEVLAMHRTTAYRHLEKARKEIAEGTRNKLLQNLNVRSDSDLQSLLRLVRSRIHLSLTRLLPE